MSVEGILFYGLTIPEDEPGWCELLLEYDGNIGRILMERFHADLLNDRAWIKRLRSFGGDHVTALSQKLAAEAIFGGCRVNGFGDRRRGPARHYAAICGTELVGRTEGAQVNSDLLETRDRQEWDERLHIFCERLGIGFSRPGWQLAFWWC
jgi:hypothetical protein